MPPAKRTQHSNNKELIDQKKKMSQSAKDSIEVSAMNNKKSPKNGKIDPNSLRVTNQGGDSKKWDIQLASEDSSIEM